MTSNRNSDATERMFCGICHFTVVVLFIVAYYALMTAKSGKGAKVACLQQILKRYDILDLTAVMSWTRLMNVCRL